MEIFLMREEYSGINEDLNNHFNSKFKQIINRFVIFNIQTERIAVIQTHKFVAENQAYLRKLGGL